MLRDTEVYSNHSELEVYAANIECDTFLPHLQAILCNYAKVAKLLDFPKPFRDDL